MNIIEIAGLAEKLGCRIHIIPTGIPDYKHGFIECKAGGVQYGRVTFYRGEYSHVKWYSRPQARVGPRDYYLAFAWDAALRTGRVPSKQEFEAAWDRAAELLGEHL